MLICLIGPTASGKSALALELARRLGGEILAVDSMTVYQRMDIGTAKPTPAERAEIPHHGLDLVPPTEEFTVSKFVAMADAAIADCARRNVPLIAVGGTPLYYVSLFKGLFEGPEGNEEIRQRLRALPTTELHDKLKLADPEAAERIHVNDQKRLVRALEVFEITGKPITHFQTEWESGKPRHTAHWFGLHWDREELNRRINARARQMFADGWISEVTCLPETLSMTAGEAAGYETIRSYLRALLTEDEALEEIKQSTRQLARRQMKWLRRFEGVTWLPGNDTVEANVSRILAAIGEK
jgi:tRNA dimethylallyltransferase